MDKPLNEFITEVGTPRVYFGQRTDIRETVTDDSITKRNQLIRACKPHHNVPFLAVKLDSATAPDCIHIVRNDPTKIRLIADYVPTYLTSSLIKNILFAPVSYDTKARLDVIVFSWYYYWFVKSDKDITNITHNVCFQLEETIKTILDKELTLYRAFETAEAISALRFRLSSERLVNMGGGTARGVNLRRL